MKMYKVVLIILSILFLPSCLPSTQLGERAIVEAVGIDKNEGMFTVSIQYYNLENTNLKSSQNPSVTHSAKTISEAIEGINAKISKRLYFGHNNFIAVGKSAAENDIEDVLEYFDLNPETKSDICIFVTENAQKIISFEDEKNSLSPLSILKVIEKSVENGSGCDYKMYTVIESNKSATSSFVLPIGKISDDKLFEIGGAYLFKNGVLVDNLNKEETRGLQWYRGKISDFLFSTDEYDIEVTGCRTTLETYALDELPAFKIKVSVELKRPTVILDNEEQTKEAISSQITREIKKVISAAFTNHKCDIFQFSKYLKVKSPKFLQKTPQWYASPSANIEVEVSCFFT